MAMHDFNLLPQPYEGGKAPMIRSHGCIKDGWIRLNLDPSSLVNDDMHVRVTSEHPSNEPHLFISKIQGWSDPVIECGPLPFTGAVRIEVRQWIDLGWGDWSDSTSWMITTKPKLPRVSSKLENQSLVVILIPQPSKEIYSYKLVSNGQQFDFSLVGHRTRTFVCLVPKNKFIRQHSLKFRIIPMLKHNRQGIPLSDDGSVLPPPTREGLWTADLRTDCTIIEYRRWMISNSSSQSSLSLANYYYEMQNELMIWLKIELNNRLSLGTCVNVFCHFCEITSQNGGLTTDSMMSNKRRILKSMIESAAGDRKLDVQWLAAMALLRSLKGSQPSDEDLECLMNVYRKTVDFSEDRSQTTRLMSNGFGALTMSEVLKELKQSMKIETRRRQHILVYLLFFNLISISLSLIPRISDAVMSDFQTTKKEVLKQLKKVRMTWLIGKNGSANERRFQEFRQLDQKWLGDRPFPFEDLRTIAVEKQRKRSRSEMNNEGRQPQNEEKEERPPLLPSKRSNSVMSTEEGPAPKISRCKCTSKGKLRVYLDPSSVISNEMHVHIISNDPSIPDQFLLSNTKRNRLSIKCGSLSITGDVQIRVQQWKDKGFGEWSNISSCRITKKPIGKAIEYLVIILITDSTDNTDGYQLDAGEVSIPFSEVDTNLWVCLVKKTEFKTQSLKFRVIPQIHHSTEETHWTADLRSYCFIIDCQRDLDSDSLADYYNQKQSALMNWIMRVANKDLAIGNCLSVFCHFCEKTSQAGGVHASMMKTHERRILKSTIEIAVNEERIHLQWLAAMALLRCLKDSEPSDEDLGCLMTVYRKTVNISEDRSLTARKFGSGLGQAILNETLKQIKQCMIDTRSRQHILVYLLFFNLISISLSLIPRISDAVMSDFQTTKKEVLKQLKKKRMAWLIGDEGSRDEARFLECSEMDQKWPGDRPFPFEDLRTIAVEKQRKRSRSEMNNEGRQPQNEEKEERHPLLPSKRSNVESSVTGIASFQATLSGEIGSDDSEMGTQLMAQHTDVDDLDDSSSVSASADQTLDNSAGHASTLERGSSRDSFDRLRSNPVAKTLSLTPDSSVDSGGDNYRLSTPRMRKARDGSDEEDVPESLERMSDELMRMKQRVEIQRKEKEDEKLRLRGKVYSLIEFINSRRSLQFEDEDEQSAGGFSASLRTDLTVRAAGVRMIEYGQEYRSSPWFMNSEQKSKYFRMFGLADFDNDGAVDLFDCQFFFKENGMNEDETELIWGLFDTNDTKNTLGQCEFAAMAHIIHIVSEKKEIGHGIEHYIPSSLPDCLKREVIAKIGTMVPVD